MSLSLFGLIIISVSSTVVKQLILFSPLFLTWIFLINKTSPSKIGNKVNWFHKSNSIILFEESINKIFLNAFIFLKQIPTFKT